MYHVFFAYSSDDGLFHVSTIVHSAAMDSGMRVFSG